MINSLVPLVELYGQTDDFILRYVERLHNFSWFQLAVLCVEVPPPLHFICQTETHYGMRHVRKA